MTIPVLTPPVQPSQNGKKTTGYRVLKSDFGDGYTQRSGDGINNVMRKVTLDFENMLPADADTLETFFNNLYGVLPFHYTLPLESVQRAWISGDIVRTYPGPNSVTLSVPFEEVFDIL